MIIWELMIELPEIQSYLDGKRKAARNQQRSATMEIMSGN